MEPIRIRVASPCSADWGSMTGDERVRFCALCSKNVYNLSAMTQAETRKLIEEKEGNLCVQFFQRKDGTVLTSDCPVGLAALRRRLHLWLGGAVGLLLAVFGLVAVRRGEDRTGRESFAFDVWEWIETAFGGRRTMGAMNSRYASASLKALVSNQAIWKSGGEHGQNGESDYWTADIAGMFYISPTAAKRKVTAPSSDEAQVGVAEIGLQEVDATLARADARLASDYPGHQPSPKAGYWFRALSGYIDSAGSRHPYGVRNAERFGFCAYPARYGSSGRQTYLVSEAGTIWRKDTSGLPPDYFPADPAAEGWSLLD